METDLIYQLNRWNQVKYSDHSVLKAGSQTINQTVNLQKSWFLASEPFV